MPTTPETQRTADAPADFVSQSEIEKILAMAGGEGGGATLPSEGGNTGEDLPERCEFPSVSLLTASELRKLRVRHEGFIQSLAARLSLHFRLEVNLKMIKLETMPYSRFVEGLNTLTHITIFKLEPFRGSSLLEIPLPLALRIIERELGGAASASDQARELTRMEERLMGRVVENILSEWCCSWLDVIELRPIPLRTENNARFIQGHQPHDSMLVLGIEMNMGDLAEQIQFAFPCQSLKPVLVKLNQEPEMAACQAEQGKGIAPAWNPHFNEVGLNISADLPGLELSTRELGTLKPGDVIPFDSELARQIQVCLESSPKFIGTLGVSGKQLAVQISKRMDAE